MKIGDKSKEVIVEDGKAFEVEYEIVDITEQENGIKIYSSKEISRVELS